MSSINSNDKSMASAAMNGIAVVLGDGGIKGGFVAGAADALFKLVPETQKQLKVMVAASASVGNVIYYLSFEKDHPGYQMWTEVLASKEFINFRGIADFYSDKPIYDIDHMVDIIFRKRFPVDEAKISGTAVSFYFPVQTIESQKPIFITNRGDGTFDRDGSEVELLDYRKYGVYDVIRAASAAPFIFDRSVKLGDREFMEAAAIEPIPLDLPGMDKLKKIIIITKRKPNLFRLWRNMFVTLLFIGLIWPFKRTRYPIIKYWQYARKPFILRRKLREIEYMQSKGDAIILTPQRAIGGLLDNDPETLIDTYRHGEEVVAANLRAIELMCGVTPT